MSNEILDAEELLEECDGDKEMLTRWVEIFDRDCQERMPKLQAAVQDGDCEALMSQAHAIKGGVGNFFAIAASETAHKLEMMGRNKDPGDAEATLRALESDLEQLKQALDELINS